MKRGILVALLASAALLRLLNIGYSDFQGDEIKALYNPKEGNNLQFFLDQRKGPLQFIVTAVVKGVSSNYHNYTLVRLPFALAGVASVAVFYVVARGLTNSKIALYSTIFFATNGFLVAFSRLVQYQSLVIFFGLLSIYLVQRYLSTDKPQFLIWAAISLALSSLAHYDAVFFMPIIIGLLIEKYFSIKDKPGRKDLFTRFAFSAGLFLLVSGVFYIPFLLNIAESTTSYWSGRITGDVSGKISSSRYLFTVYQPIYVIHIYTILGTLGFGLLSFLCLYKLVPFIRSKFIALSGIHPDFSIERLSALIIWFLIPFIVMEVLIYIPGTHLYTYLIPACLFLGFALYHTELVIKKYLKIFMVIYNFSIIILAAFLIYQSYMVFTDHSAEYPWENKPFLLWTLPKPSPIYHLSIFGFPYNRHWLEMSDYINSDDRSAYYSCNERTSISRYYINKTKSGDLAGYYLVIYNPQTFTNNLNNNRLIDWMTAHEPVRTYYNGDQAVSRIYIIE